MKRLPARTLPAALLLVLFLAVPATAGPALDWTKTSVEKVLSILRDPAYAAPESKPAQRKVLRTAADELFDWPALARRAAALEWKTMNPAQRKEFTELFSRILEKTYMDRIQAYTNEVVRFDKETVLDAGKADVSTTVVTSSKDIPISYRLYDTGGGAWRVYDVFVEGVSLVKNYRSQFKDILAKDSVDELLAQMRKKVAE
ncbi:MAG TPA: ABC transporter substrate-binding protein [Spirochaetales bacterium]|nr:ABC transporter substrate-binding protein [Spirochaetales bacterium]